MWNCFIFEDTKVYEIIFKKIKYELKYFEENGEWIESEPNSFLYLFISK